MPAMHIDKWQLRARQDETRLAWSSSGKFIVHKFFVLIYIRLPAQRSLGEVDLLLTIWFRHQVILFLEINARSLSLVTPPPHTLRLIKSVAGWAPGDSLLQTVEFMNKNFLYSSERFFIPKQKENWKTVGDCERSLFTRTKSKSECWGKVNERREKKRKEKVC